MKLKRKYIYWILGLIVIFLVIKSAVQFVIIAIHQTPYSESVLMEYKKLFPEKKRRYLSKVWNYNSAVRNQFSLFDYGKNKEYSILVYKIPAKNPFAFKNIELKKSDRVEGGGYIVINENYTEFCYKIGKPAIAKSIKLSYEKGVFKLVSATDSMRIYYYYGNQLAITLNGEDEPDIYGGAKNHFMKLPFNIPFIKKQKNIYLIIMTVNRLSDSFQSNELNKILESKIK